MTWDSLLIRSSKPSLFFLHCTNVLFFLFFSLNLFVSSSERKEGFFRRKRGFFSERVLSAFLSPHVGGKVDSHLFSALLSLECLRNLLLFPLYAIIMIRFSVRDIFTHREELTVTAVPRTEKTLGHSLEIFSAEDRIVE